MLFEDFCKYFKNAAVCRVINTSILSLRKTWTEALFNGEWKPGRDGGCINNRETFLQNPQVRYDWGRFKVEFFFFLAVCNLFVLGAISNGNVEFIFF